MNSTWKELKRAAKSLKTLFYYYHFDKLKNVFREFSFLQFVTSKTKNRANLNRRKKRRRKEKELQQQQQPNKRKHISVVYVLIMWLICFKGHRGTWTQRDVYKSHFKFSSLLYLYLTVAVSFFLCCLPSFFSKTYEMFCVFMKTYTSPYLEMLFLKSSLLGCISNSVRHALERVEIKTVRPTIPSIYIVFNT